MAEKRIATKINLPYDSYENWMKSSRILGAGEVAFAYIKDGDTQEVNSVTVPQVLIKVGNGTDLFKDLPFATAKAGDVYGWAKGAVKPEYQASEIKGLEDFIAGEIQDTNTTYKLEQDANNAHVIRLYSKELGASEWTEEASITTADTAYNDIQVKADVAANLAAIEALQGLVGNTNVATQIGNAIAALDLANTYAAKAHTHTKAEITDFAHNHEMGEVNGLVDALAGKEAAGEAAKVQANLDAYVESNDAAVALKADKTALEAEVERAEGVEAGLQSAIDAINNAETGILKQAKDYADGKDEAIAAAKKAGDDAQDDLDAFKTTVSETYETKEDADAKVVEVKGYTDAEVKKVADDLGALELVVDGVKGVADKNVEDIASLAGRVDSLEKGTYDDTEVRGLISDNAGAIAELEQTHATDKAALEASIKTNADAIELLTNGVSADEVDGVNDLIKYVKDHGAEVTGIKADIKQNADDIDALEERMNTAEEALGTVDSRIEAAITGANLEQFATKETVEAMDERLVAAEDEIDALQEAIETKVETSVVEALDGRVVTVEGEVATLKTAMNTKADKTTVEALDSRVVVVEGKAHEHEHADELAKILNGDVAKWNAAEQNAKDYADSLADNYDAKGSADKALEDAKTYADGLAENYDVKGAADDALAQAKEYADGLNTAMDARVSAIEAVDLLILDCGNAEVTA